MNSQLWLLLRYFAATHVIATITFAIGLSNLDDPEAKAMTTALAFMVVFNSVAMPVVMWVRRHVFAKEMERGYRILSADNSLIAVTLLSCAVSIWGSEFWPVSLALAVFVVASACVAVKIKTIARPMP